jgi:mRNA-degrading endonuclease toxin of MazEF toxin-antitoxin module
MNPRPGEIRLADPGLAARTRPVVIVSRLDSESPRALVTYIPLTTQTNRPRKAMALHHAALERNRRPDRWRYLGRGRKFVYSN